LTSRRNLPVLSVAAAPVVTHGPVIPQVYANPGLSLMQIFSIVWAYRMHTMVIAAVVVIFTAVYAKLLPKTYTATATLMVNYESNNDPLAGGQMPSARYGNYMSTEMQLMVSAEVLLPVIDRLKLTDNKTYAAGYRGDGSTLRDWVKENLQKDLEIGSGQAGSQLIYVTASARNALLAAQIANTLSDIYLDQERQRVSGPASERAKRYAQELSELKDKVRVAQDQVTAFRQRTGVTDAAAKNNNIESELLAALETRLQEAQNARRGAEVKAMGDQHLSAGAAGSVAVQDLRKQINIQETQLAQLRATFGTRHPKVLELQGQIEATRRNLNSELQNFSAGASSDLVASRQLEEKLRAAVEEQRTKVLGISRLQDEGTKFVLELESAQSVYKRALEGYDQIMFASGGHSTNISMVSRAVPPQKASKPNKIKLLLVGAIAGLFLGLLGPMAYELLLNRRVRCRDDFERDFAVPVLIEFDAIFAAKTAAGSAA
jgi:succinoglycan biosynthesis transport protein ExoP